MQVAAGSSRIGETDHEAQPGSCVVLSAEWKKGNLERGSRVYVHGGRMREGEQIARSDPRESCGERLPPQAPITLRALIRSDSRLRLPVPPPPTSSHAQASRRCPRHRPTPARILQHVLRLPDSASRIPVVRAVRELLPSANERPPTAAAPHRSGRSHHPTIQKYPCASSCSVPASSRLPVPPRAQLPDTVQHGRRERGTQHPHLRNPGHAECIKSRCSLGARSVIVIHLACRARAAPPQPQCVPTPVHAARRGRAHRTALHR